MFMQSTPLRITGNVTEGAYNSATRLFEHTYSYSSGWVVFIFKKENTKLLGRTVGIGKFGS